MLVREANGNSLRLGRAELKRLAWALGISLMIHGAGYGGYQAGKNIFPKWADRIRSLASWLLPPPRPKPPVADPDPPLLFVDVNPDTATPEPPKDAKFYSNRNSQAANP